MQVTQAMIDSYKLHRDVCLANGIGQSTFKHRSLEGTVTTDSTPGAGGNGRNKRWKPPTASRANPTSDDSLLWIAWVPKEVKGTQVDAGDSEAVEMWGMRAVVQFPSIDDNQAVVVVSDADWIVAPDGTWFKVENPAISPDAAFWTATVIPQR